MDKYCKNCGSPLKADAKFCASCGTAIQSAQKQPVTATGSVNNPRDNRNVYEPSSHRNQPLDSRKKKKLFIALFGVLALFLLAGTGILFFTKNRSKIEIISCSPQSGSLGEFVLIELNQAVDETGLEVFYGSEAIQGSRITDTVIAVNVPLDAESDHFLVKYKNMKAKTSFTVMREERIELSKETAVPSSEMQSISCADDIVITLPENFLKEEKIVTVSRVDNPAVLVDTPYGLPTVYDISIEGMEQLPQNIEIAMKYDPSWFEDGASVADYLEPRRWDEKNQVWVDLYYRVDEDTQTVHFLTDHLSAFSYFLTGFKWIGLAKTAAIVGGTSYALEWLANDVYISPENNFRILYSQKGVSEIFPEDDWIKAMAGGSLTRISRYSARAPMMLHTVGSVLEDSLKAYLDAGFEDPTRNRFASSIYTRRVKVKIDSYWNFYGAGEFSYNAFWDQINLPTEIVKIEVFDPAKDDPSAYKKAEAYLTQVLAHELFHAIQLPYYGSYTDLGKGRHLWWMEASAEYAANDIAWKRTGTVLNERLGNKFFEYPLNSTGKKTATYSSGSTLDYEYLSAIFIRYLTQQAEYDFKEMVKFVAATGWDIEPVSALGEFARTKSDVNFALLYRDFVVWMLEEGNLTAADFNNPDNKDTVAEKSQSVSIPKSRVTVILEKQESHSGEVAIFKSSGNADGYQPQLEYVNTIKESSIGLETEVNAGDALYFIATNGDATERDVTVRIKLKEEESKDTNILAEHSFVVDQYGAAKIWAVKLEVGHWTIEPDKVEEGQFNEEYMFTVKGEKIAKEVQEVRLEYDFGDGGKNARGSAIGTVRSGGMVEIDLKYIYEIPDNLNAEEDILYPVNVKIMNGDSLLGSVSATVEIKPVTVSILPPRIITYELTEGAREAEHTFEAAVRPEGSYRFEWDFGDGSPMQNTQGDSSTISHTYTGIGTWHPRVTLYSDNGAKLAEDRVTIILEYAEGASPSETPAASAEPAKPPESAKEYAWVLTEVIDHENADRWAQADAHVANALSYSYSRGSYSASVTYEGGDPYKEGRKGTFGLQAVFTGIPDIIYPDKPVSLNFSFSTTQNDTVKLSYTGSAAADFDQWDVEPGGVTGRAQWFATADGKDSFTLDVNGNPSSYGETLTATLGTGNEGSRIALRTRFSLSGVPMGTNYVYEWKQVGSSAPLLDTEGIDGIVDID